MLALLHPRLPFLCGLLLAAGAMAGPRNQADGPLSAEEVGTRVVAAIRTGDVKPLEMFVAATGIELGGEEPLSAAAFVAQLEQKRGSYCVLMDTSCLLGARPGAPDASLRSRMLRQPIAVRSSPRGDFPEMVELQVAPQGRPDAVLFRVFVRRTHEGWRLVRIQYN